MVALGAAIITYSQSIVGTWQGTLPAGASPRIVLKIAKAGSGTLHGSIIFPDRSAESIPLRRVIYRAKELNAAVGETTFRGNLSADGKSIAGTWTQSDQAYPLHLTLATPDTLWSYSGPSAMSAPDPSFEVATIKPSRPDAKTGGYSWRTRLFQARDHTVAELIQFAYQVRKRQIDGGPSWMKELRFDVAGEPNAPG